ncbi:MAG: TRAP-type transport system periplasmic protein [Thermoanaerobacteraceae bacterium]|nr:TRAP-type transport system periplasmic protein [Thermoanaerobacteraceae bacterium]
MLKMQFKLFTLVLVLMMLVVVGCGTSTKTQPNSDTKAQDQNQNSDKIVLKLAHDQQPNQGYGIGVNKMVQEVKDKTNGKVEIQVFDRGVLGNERDVVEGLKMGTIDMAIITAGTLTNFEPKMAAINMPFIFRDWDHVNKALEGSIANEVFPALESKQKIKPLAVYALGFRNIATTKKEIKSVDDLKGLKIRVPQAPVFLSTFKALGANPTPMAWGELYTSLQTNVVDGFENSAQVMDQFKMYEVTKYLTITNHIWEGGVVLISDKAWEKLTPEFQRVLQNAALESAKYQRDQVKAQDEDMIKSLKDKGMKVTQIPREQLEKVAKPVYDELGKQYGIESLIKEIQGL